MDSVTIESNRRILVVDDNHLIHGDFHKIFATGHGPDPELDKEAELLFGEDRAPAPRAGFSVDSAYDGHEALEKVRQAKDRGKPYAMAIVDMRMPVGWDGAETTRRIWEIDPDVQVVICTAYSDFSWRDIMRTIGAGDRLLVLKKPFDPVEAIQMANMLTEKWTLEQRARLKAQHLERLVEERTVDLRRKHLDLQKKNEEIQYFYHTLSHELKTPLTAAKEFIAIVSEGLVGDLNPTQLEYLDIAAKSCSRLAIYINDLFDAARLDTGKLQLNLKPVSLANLVQEIQTTMRTQAASKDITLYADVEEGLDPVLADEDRIMQILTNLYNNALKFTPEGGSIGITLHRDHERADWVKLAVADNGCGILEDELGRLFERYYQVEQVDPDQARGVGLGLYLIRELVTLHGGDVAVDSTLGKGTTFTVSLPVKGAAEPTSTTAENTGAGSAAVQ